MNEIEPPFRGRPGTSLQDVAGLIGEIPQCGRVEPVDVVDERQLSMNAKGERPRGKRPVPRRNLARRLPVPKGIAAVEQRGGSQGKRIDIPHEPEVSPMPVRICKNCVAYDHLRHARSQRLRIRPEIRARRAKPVVHVLATSSTRHIAHQGRWDVFLARAYEIRAAACRTICGFSNIVRHIIVRIEQAAK